MRSARVVYSGGGFMVQVTENFKERLRGLIAVKDPQPLWLWGTRAVHGMGIRGNLELWFLDPNFVVLKIQILHPWGMAFCSKARHTLELRAGSFPPARLGERIKLLMAEGGELENGGELDP